MHVTFVLCYFHFAIDQYLLLQRKILWRKYEGVEKKGNILRKALSMKVVELFNAASKVELSALLEGELKVK
jgi:hypothetical protein